MNYKFLIQYDGSRYKGWQKQGNTSQTIQAKLENVLAGLAGCPVELHGSGRTDAGVHAAGQVANAHFQTDKTPQQIRDYVNRYLPQDIAVLEVTAVDGRFHSRLHAKEKTYCYRIWQNPVRDVFSRKYTCMEAGGLDTAAMCDAAALLTGEHDFTSFCGRRSFKKSKVRIVSNIRIEQAQNELLLWFTGNGFLPYMVRILAGTLVEVGQGKRTAGSMVSVLEAKDREAAGKTMPACGLTLVSVTYG